MQRLTFLTVTSICVAICVLCIAWTSSLCQMSVAAHQHVTSGKPLPALTQLVQASGNLLSLPPLGALLFALAVSWRRNPTPFDAIYSLSLTITLSIFLLVVIASAASLPWIPYLPGHQ